MSDTVIKVENLSKSYTISHQTGERYTALRDVLANGVRSVVGSMWRGARLRSPHATHHTPPASPTTEEFWALNDVSFEIKQGAPKGPLVGIPSAMLRTSIGRNGAGKCNLMPLILVWILHIISHPFIVVGGLTILGAALRLYHLGYKSLWLDEAALYWIANGDLLDVITQNAGGNSAPPLFAILISFILKIGESEFVLRFIPWLAGVAAIPAMYILARQFLTRNLAYLCTLLVVIAPTQVTYSQQLREYSLTFLWSILILIFFKRYLDKPNWKDCILLTCILSVGIFIQYGLAILVLALNFIVFTQLLFSKTTSRNMLLQWSVSQLVVLVVVFVVYELSLKQQLRIGFGVQYLAHAYWNGSLSSLIRLAVVNSYAIIAFAFPALPLFLVTLITGLIAIAQNIRKERQAQILLLLLIVPFICTFITALFKIYPYHGGRQIIFLTPMIYILAVAGIGSIASLHPKHGIVLASIISLMLVMSGMEATASYLEESGPQNVKPLVDVLSTTFTPDDKIYIYAGAAPAFSYYYRENRNAWSTGLMIGSPLNAHFQQLNEIFASGDRVWMIFSHCGDWSECKAITQYASWQRKVELVSQAADAELYLAHEPDANIFSAAPAFANRNTSTGN